MKGKALRTDPMVIDGAGKGSFRIPMNGAVALRVFSPTGAKDANFTINGADVTVPGGAGLMDVLPPDGLGTERDDNLVFIDVTGVGTNVITVFRDFYKKDG